MHFKLAYILHQMMSHSVPFHTKILVKTKPILLIFPNCIKITSNSSPKRSGILPLNPVMARIPFVRIAYSPVSPLRELLVAVTTRQSKPRILNTRFRRRYKLPPSQLIGHAKQRHHPTSLCSLDLPVFGSLSTVHLREKNPTQRRCAVPWCYI